eukprot:CAMPEP_0185201410 /NCGR_PEP_ID=MMETSP1140-20130426/49192_1 /TAXON_ID=298111 /ORGANISM="Pavlova sp., Strain CCMP459" /LENGTH=117 /DNA_ID=CAMNT_0027768799 /DNA_START=596 /DNA_END=946 /DNA_ORIENTATION=+
MVSFTWPGRFSTKRILFGGNCSSIATSAAGASVLLGAAPAAAGAPVSTAAGGGGGGMAAASSSPWPPSSPAPATGFFPNSMTCLRFAARRGSRVPSSRAMTCDFVIAYCRRIGLPKN